MTAGLFWFPDVAPSERPRAGGLIRRRPFPAGSTRDLSTGFWDALPCAWRGACAIFRSGVPMFVGGSDQRFRDGEAEGLGGFEIEDE
jgi:hypothetical protein